MFGGTLGEHAVEGVETMRADAAERRAKIVKAARQVFASQGEEAALDVVAHAAGVGIATLYRNFGSREELAEEVARSILVDIRNAAVETQPILTSQGDVAWRGFVRRLVDLDISALSSALARYETGELSNDLRQLQQEVLEDVENLLDSATQLGLVRSSMSALELVLLLGLITEPKSQAVREHVPDFVDNVTAVILAGLAAGTNLSQSS